MAYINHNVSTMAMPSGMNRMGQFPLDMSSVYYDEASLRAYAESGAIAYVGQILSLVDETNSKVTVYSIQDTAGTLKEVGTVPAGDAKTITVAADGTISLAGIEDLVFSEEVTDEESGETSTITHTYQALLTADGLTWVEPSKTTVEGLATLIEGLTARVDALEKKEDKDTTYSVATGEQVLKLTGTEFSTEISIKHENGRISLTGINGTEIAGFSTADFTKDSFLQNAEYDAETQELVFTWNTESGITEDRVDIGDLIDTYTATGTAGTTVTVTASTDANVHSISAEVNAGSLTDAHIAADAAIAQSKISGLTDVLAAKLEADALEGYATSEELQTVSDKADSNANSITNLTGRIDGIVAGGGEPNLINSIKRNGVTLAIADDKSVDILVPIALSELTGYTELDNRVTAAQTKGEEGVTKAGEANTVAAAAQSTATEALGKANANDAALGGHLERIIALETANTTHNAQYEALSGTVSEHTATLAAIPETYAKQTDLAALTTTVTGHTTAFTTLNETTLPAMNEQIGLKANSADVYTKTEADAITGTPDAGKTIVQMIKDLEANGYDDTEVRDLISDNADAIASEIERAQAAEKANADAITVLNSGVEVEGSVDYKVAQEVAKILNDNDASDIDTLEEIAAWITNDTAGVADLNRRVTENTNAIAAINNETTGILVTAKAYSDTNLSTAKTYTDDSIAALQATIHGVDDKTIKLADNKAYVAEVSTDLLVQGEQELILYAGTAGATN